MLHEFANTGIQTLKKREDAATDETVIVRF